MGPSVGLGARANVRVVAAAGGAAAVVAVGLMFVLSGASAKERKRAGSGEEGDGQAPLCLDANRGQTDPRVNFISRGAGYALFLTPRESVLSLSTPARAGSESDAKPKQAVLRMRLTGANPHPAVAGAQPLPGRTNYLRGNDPSKWQTGVPGFGQVRYASVYPGVDLVYHGKQGKLEYDFVVAPGADPDRIALRFSGARSVSLDGAGNLVLRTKAGTVTQPKPVVYQTIAGERHAVPARFVLADGNRVSFELGAYDRARPLVIDPEVVYSTYLGGLSQDTGEGIAADSAGNAYVTGATSSPDFPTKSPLRGSPNQGQDAFVTKISPDGSALVYSTYLGGAASDVGLGADVGPDGLPVITGSTGSADFPTTPGAPQGANAAGSTDAFVTKLNAAGSAPVYSTYLGGSSFDIGTDVAVDSAGAAYVTGDTDSTDFPTTAGALQPAPGGGRDAFVTKLNPAGTALDYSTDLGGAAGEEGTGIDVGPDGSAYVSGQTSSLNFPTTAGAIDESCTTTCATVAKLNPAGSALSYSTVLEAAGGQGFGTFASAYDVAVGTGANAGKAFVLGTHNGGFPVTPGALNAPFDFAFGGPVFVAKLNVAGSALEYAASIGGGGEASDFGVGTGFGGIAVDSAGHAIVTGRGIIAPVRPVAEAGGGFAASLNATGSALLWATPLGAGFPGGTAGRDLTIDAADNVYITGRANTSRFTTQNALQPRFGGAGLFFAGADGFVMKLAPSDVRAPFVASVSQKGDDAAGGRLVKVTGTGFSNTTSVQFGGVASPRFDIISSTELTAVVPPHAESDTHVTVTSGGRTSPANPIARFVYAEGRWSSQEPIPGPPRNGSAMQLPSGKVLYLTSSTADLFDPVSNSWSDAPAPGMGGRPTLLASGKVLISNGSAAVVYDPADGTSAPTSNAPSVSGTTTLLAGGKVLTIGSAAAELYDPATNAFAATGAPQQPRGGHTATLLAGGKVLVVGGGSPATAELYDPASGTFALTGAPNITRKRGHTATPLPSGKVLVAGGFDDTFAVTDSAELYDPATGAFSLTRRMTVLRQGHSAILLPSGKALLVDGGEVEDSVDMSDLYDPALGGGNGSFKSAGRTNVFLGGPSLVLIRGDAAACGSNCGKVLAIASSDRVELYTPRVVPVAPPPVAESPPPPPETGTPGSAAPVLAPLPLGLPTATPTPKPLLGRPILSRLSVRPATVPRGRGVRVSFRLNRAVTVTVSVRRSLGRGRFTGVLRSQRIRGRAGVNRAAIRARSLSRIGLYRLTAKPAGGVASKVSVRVVRSRRAASRR